MSCDQGDWVTSQASQDEGVFYSAFNWIFMIWKMAWSYLNLIKRCKVSKGFQIFIERGKCISKLICLKTYIAVRPAYKAPARLGTKSAGGC